MNTLKSKILIKRVRKGDKTAFKEIYKHFSDRIYRFIFYRVPEKEIAEDLLQEIFLKVWNYIKDEKNLIENLQALIYKICRNTIIDYYRQNGNDFLIDIEEVSYKIEDAKYNKNQKETEIDIQIDIKKIRLQLNKLKNPIFKEIIELRFLDELSYKEIAQVLEKTEKNVSVMLHRAISELKKIIEE